MSLPLKIDIFRVGHTRQRERLAQRDKGYTSVEFPALCALIIHPQDGPILYDTGYETRLLEATKTYPLKFYRDILPVYITEQERLTIQLKERGLFPKDIRNVVVSHFHADHIGGLKDFSAARVICLQKDCEPISGLAAKPWRSLFAGYVPDLLPETFNERSLFTESLTMRSLPTSMRPFETGYDLLGDGSALGIPLPGHTPGQLGLFLPETDKGPVFLVADACWSLPACKKGVLPSSLALCTAFDKRLYKETFFRIKELANREPKIRIIPAHCMDTWKAWHV